MTEQQIERGESLLNLSTNSHYRVTYCKGGEEKLLYSASISTSRPFGEEEEEEERKNRKKKTDPTPLKLMFAYNRCIVFLAESM